MICEAMNKKPMVILTGPTAVGKTKLSIALAKALNGEIISADSIQVYKYMDIGSAKITEEEMQGVKHYMVDIMSPFEDFNVSVFKSKCEECLEEIYKNGHIPIIVGGTGFYIQAILNDISFTENDDNKEIRAELEQFYQEKGVDYLFDMLMEIDPKSAEVIHKNNVKRVIRAIEYFRLTGQKISEHNETERQKDSAYNSCYFVLNDEREKLYSKIEIRIDEMLKQGLVEEVKKLKEMGCSRNMVSMQGLGYKEILDYLDGNCTLDEAVDILKRDTRHFAKRQLTWFRREKEVIWVNKDEFKYDDEKILEFMLGKCKNQGII